MLGLLPFKDTIITTKLKGMYTYGHDATKGVTAEK